jgi:Zn-dependent protease with chaperone function
MNCWVLCFILFPEANFCLVAVSGFTGALFASYFMSREVFTGLSFKFWIHLVLAGLFIMFFGWVVLFTAILNMPDDFGWVTWVIAGVVLVLLLSLNFGLGLQIMKWFGLLKPADDHLNGLVREVSEKMGVQVRATWVVSAYLSNAAAFPLIGQVVFTQKMLETSSDDEIKSVCAHELGHLNESRKVKFVRLLNSIAFYPLIFGSPFSSIDGVGKSAFWVLLIVTLIIWLVGIRVARRMETRADKLAAENVVDPVVYARALERLYQTNQMPAVMPKRSAKIHPDLYDRMTAAGLTPDYPRPKPAKSQCWTSYLVFASLFITPVLIGAVKGIVMAANASTLNVK